MAKSLLRVSGGRAIKSPIPEHPQKDRIEPIAKAIAHARDLVKEGYFEEAVFILNELLQEIDPEGKAS